MKYVHLAEDVDLGYRLSEEILEYNERKVLYLLSELKADTFIFGCDIEIMFGNSKVARQQTKTAHVKGYVVKWKCAKDEKGLDVSELEPIGSEEQSAIREILESKHEVRTVAFQ